MENKLPQTNVKILISFTEYERLKKVEQQFLEFQSHHLLKPSKFAFTHEA